MKNKGATQSIPMVVVTIVLAIIFLVFTVPMVPKAQQWFMDFLKEKLSWLDNLFDGEKESVLGAAIKCSYYRCMKGCKSKEIEDITWKSNGAVIGCKDFCKPEWADKKICGFDSQQYPIEINYDKEETLSKSNLPEFNCMMPISETGISLGEIPKLLIKQAIFGPWWSFWKLIHTGKIGITAYNLVIEDTLIDKDRSEIGACDIMAYHEDRALKKLGINKEYIYIITDKRDFRLFHIGTTGVFETPTYMVLESNVEGEINISADDSIFHRIGVKRDGDTIDESYVQLVDIYFGFMGSGSYAKIKFNCSNGRQEDEIIFEGEEKVLCGGKYILNLSKVYADLSAPMAFTPGGVILKIKYIDCHGIPRDRMAMECTGACQLCWKIIPRQNMPPIELINSCCYKSEKCNSETGECEERPEPYVEFSNEIQKIKEEACEDTRTDYEYRPIIIPDIVDRIFNNTSAGEEYLCISYNDPPGTFRCFPTKCLNKPYNVEFVGFDPKLDLINRAKGTSYVFLIGPKRIVLSGICNREFSSSQPQCMRHENLLGCYWCSDPKNPGTGQCCESYQTCVGGSCGNEKCIPIDNPDRPCFKHGDCCSNNCIGGYCQECVLPETGNCNVDNNCCRGFVCEKTYCKPAII